MKSLYLSFCLFVLSFIVQAQSANKIVIGIVDSLHSTILNEDRKIWVYVPHMEGQPDIYSIQQYPVVYLLDGDAHFHSVTGMIQQLSQVNGNSIIPEMIVVAILNTDRTRDLTPTHIDSDLPFMDSIFSATSGGGDQFISFIEKELIPHIDAKYPTQPYKMLIGHSFGGLAVLKTLISRPDLFNAYVSIDPSMWYDKQNFLKETKNAIVGNEYHDISLFVAIANTLDENMNIETVEKDTSRSSIHVRSILDLDHHLKANSQSGLKYQSRYYADDDHGSVPQMATYDALRFIFDYYRLKLTIDDWMDSTSQLAAKFERHFVNISRQFGYEINPPEQLINTLAYESLNIKHFTKAENLFELNIVNYPESFNVYDSYGDYWLARNDSVNAMKYFEKALTKKENTLSRQKLEELQGIDPPVIDVEVLNRYAGEYEFPGMTVKTFVRGSKLFMSTPGQPEYELVPMKEHEFKIKTLTGYNIRFEMEGDHVIAAYSIQPDDTFKGSVKRKG